MSQAGSSPARRGLALSPLSTLPSSVLPDRAPGQPRPSTPAPAALPTPRPPRARHTSQSQPGRSLSLGRSASSPRRRFPTLARPKFQGPNGARAPGPPPGSRPALQPYPSGPPPGTLHRAPELSGHHRRLSAPTGYTSSKRTTGVASLPPQEMLASATASAHAPRRHAPPACCGEPVVFSRIAFPWGFCSVIQLPQNAVRLKQVN